MSRLLIPVIALILGATAALAVAGCGGSDSELLPGADANEILDNLEQVEELATNGQCASAEEAIDQVSGQVDGLPASVSDKLRQNLKKGVERLRTVTAESCGTVTSGEETTTETVPEETEETTPETTPEETEPTGPTGATGPTGGRGRGQGNGGGANNGIGGNQNPSGSGKPTPGTGGEPGQGGGGTTTEGDTTSGGEGDSGSTGGISPGESETGGDGTEP